MLENLFSVFMNSFKTWLLDCKYINTVEYINTVVLYCYYFFFTAQVKRIKKPDSAYEPVCKVATPNK